MTNNKFGDIIDKNIVNNYDGCFAETVYFIGTHDGWDVTAKIKTTFHNGARTDEVLSISENFPDREIKILDDLFHSRFEV